MSAQSERIKEIRQLALVEYKCQYCNTAFIPKKRFSQKYCGESCRVMACRERKTGFLNGLNELQPERKTNIQVLQNIELNQKELNKKLDRLQDHLHYIEIGGIIKFIADWYQQTQIKNLAKDEKERNVANMKGLLGLVTKNNKTLKDELKTIMGVNPAYSEILSGLF